MTLAYLRRQLACVLATALPYLAVLALNELLFARLEFLPGIHWVYLPAGMRLLSTLLFAEAGAVGLLLASWAVSFLYFFPHDFERAFVGGILAALAPWAVYRGARRWWGLGASLASLTPRRLLLLCLAYSLANPLLQHLYLALRGGQDLWRSFFVMFLGDLDGTLIVIYAMKMALALLPRRA